MTTTSSFMSTFLTLAVPLASLLRLSAVFMRSPWVVSLTKFASPAVAGHVNSRKGAGMSA
jgi:hypothetical protein